MLENTLLFLDISGGEFLVILLVAFFVFGPKKLPEIARKLGRTMNEIKSVSGELTKEFRDETRSITTELKSARESARINTSNLDISKVLDPAIDAKTEQRNVVSNTMKKPAPESSDTGSGYNNDAANIVNGEKEIN